MKLVKKWLKYSIHMTKAQRKTIGPLWKVIVITFSFRFYDIFFVYNVIQTSCFFCQKKVADLYEQSSCRVSSAVTAYWNL